MKFTKLFTLILISLMIILIFGCSGGGTPTAPVDPPEGQSITGAHYTWGLWQMHADPVNQTLDVIQLREGNFHLNAIVFLEPPPLLNLTIETLEFNGNIIDVDIGLRHPFLGLTEFTGFDVCGILISNGSYSGYDDPDIVHPGNGDTWLMNPDGLTRWWNPSEFPVNNGTIFGYNDGLLGAPDVFGNYNSTLNGYKLFCDDISIPDASLSDLDPSTRCTFAAGQKNVRHYTIELGDDGLVFNYAIDANWQFPNGDPPWSVEDFRARGESSRGVEYKHH